MVTHGKAYVPFPDNIYRSREGRVKKEAEEKPNVSKPSPQTLSADSWESRIETQKQIVEKLKAEWNLLWTERFNDKERAEGVSISDYELLRVQKGTIIYATKDFKPLNFKEIVEEHTEENAERFTQPDVHVGGWSKFIKTKISPRKAEKILHTPPKNVPKDPTQQAKKGGRGWLHAK